MILYHAQPIGKRTCGSSLQLFRRNPKDLKNFHQYFRDYVRHRRSRRHVRIGLESGKEISYALEELCENVFTRRNTLGRLSDVQRENAPPKELDRILT